MPLPYDLDGVRTRTTMYVGFAEFDIVAAYIDGLNAATHDSLLLGFREWLVPRVGGGTNLVWSEIVLLYLAFPGVADPRAQLQEAGNHARAIECLFTNLEEFWAERYRSSGMRAIYLRFQAWLKRQEWYSPEFPDWIDDEGIGVKGIGPGGPG